MDAPTLDPILAQIAEIRQRRAELDNLDWTIPEAPDLGAPRDDNRIRPVTSTSLKPLPEPITSEMLRELLPIKLHDYLAGDKQDALLVKVPPGEGKTHAMVAVAQFYARHGKRGLWAASRHNMFSELANFPHFEPSLWYHWQGIGREVDDVPMCKHSDAQARWAQLGYKAFELCKQLCVYDGHISECPYRLQEKRQEPLIFGQHQHLTSGMSISDFDFCVVDELPLGAFVDHRMIPIDGLDVGATGPTRTLTDTLASMCGDAQPKRRVSGAELFKRIGPILDDVYAQIELDLGATPEVPRIYDAYQVSDAPYWYIMDFLTLAAAEHRAWRESWPLWAERIWLTRGGLHMLKRSDPWESLPIKIVVLDATAQADLYKIILRRDCQVYAPVVERKGHVYQVAGRLNGKRATLNHGGDLSSSGREMLDIVKRMADGRPGIVCWKSIAPHFAREFGEENVLTFGGLRGSNRLQDVGTLFVCGTPTPPHQDMIDLAAALSDDVKPFFSLDPDGNRIPLYSHGEREYRLSEFGLTQARDLFGPDTAGVTRRIGYYKHPIIDAIHRQLREAEIIQALHRARVNLRDATVWLLTSTPTDEPIDGVWNDPPFGPPEINWRIWLRLEPWLKAQHAAGASLTYENLAEAVDVTLNYVQHNKWLDVIASYMPDMWQISSLIPAGRGRPGRIVVPLKESAIN